MSKQIRESTPNRAPLTPCAALLAAVIGMGFAGAVQAADENAGSNSLSGSLTSNALFSHDSDDFDTYKLSAGYLFTSGWGLGLQTAHFSAPGWSANGNALFAQYQERSKERNIEARLGATRTAGHTELTGMLDYMQRMGDKTWLGVSAERDVVESVRGIEKGMHYDSLMAVLDHQFNDRFNVGAVAGATRFSDDNTRSLLRTRWNFELVPQSGFNAYLKTRNYHNNNPYQGNYFAPANLGEYSLGLSWRTALTDRVVLFANADAGRQRIDGDHNTIWSARAGLQNRHTSKVQWQVALDTTNNRASTLAGGSNSYRYTALTARLLYPF